MGTAYFPFVPIIVVLFFFLSLLEDTGYMSRIAFVMDKLLRKIGLSGSSFVPMLMGLAALYRLLFCQLGRCPASVISG